MATVRSRDGKLFIDFRYMGQRCREPTVFKDTSQNQSKLKKILERMEAEILLGTFVYENYFPKSSRLDNFKLLETRKSSLHLTDTVYFQVYVNEWKTLKKIEWRPSYQAKVSIIIDKYLNPYFGKKFINSINKTDLLQFRASLAKVNHEKKQQGLTASRINQIMIPLRMILNEAAERYSFESPFKNIKNLKESKPDVMPFTLQEVQKILSAVRQDFKPYYVLRFFTGMRTSEIDGLKWKNINFNRREIYIKEALVNGILGPTKTDGSHRTIQMSQQVYEALLVQKQVSSRYSEFVFCNSKGEPLDYRLVNRRVWHPLLRYLQLDSRRAYQSRHTAATLWLSAGENPEWIAKQLGHSTTEMLFRVYSRYVPNMTRRDGSA